MILEFHLNTFHFAGTTANSLLVTFRMVFLLIFSNFSNNIMNLLMAVEFEHQDDEFSLWMLNLIPPWR